MQIYQEGTGRMTAVQDVREMSSFMFIYKMVNSMCTGEFDIGDVILIINSILTVTEN